MLPERNTDRRIANRVLAVIARHLRHDRAYYDTVSRSRTTETSWAAPFAR